jgi:hypothetical protein
MNYNGGNIKNLLVNIFFGEFNLFIILFMVVNSIKNLCKKK